jgi:predicted nucleotidyltransferase
MYLNGRGIVESQIDKRKDFTNRQTEKLQGKLSTSGFSHTRKNADYCVYVTGSFGRQEACEHSDVDLFILGGESFKRLDEICLKADLISSARALSLPEFSGDGEYLERYQVKELVQNIGTPKDDSSNTLTARLLLLLESRFLDGETSQYKNAIDDVISAYWRDFEKHRDDFMPSYLANDILLFWRTMCLNYEARTKSSPAEKLAKRKLKNYKLRHSRLMTCYSALAYLLSIYSNNKTVTPQDCKVMSQMTPVERLRSIGMKDQCDKILLAYESFLTLTDKEESKLVSDVLANETTVKTAFATQDQLGDAMFALLLAIEPIPKFVRYFLV